MKSHLEGIVEYQKELVSQLKDNNLHPRTEENFMIKKLFKKMFLENDFSIIGEIKRVSPSRGKINSIQDPINLVNQYIDGGISAISVLTNKKYFSGSTDDLVLIREHLRKSKKPVLRKDFIIDEIQIYESLYYGADAILLIISVLGEKTEKLLKYTNMLGIDAIVEVHNKDELNYAVAIGAEIIGINNRDLNTFSEDINICLNLIKYVPKGVCTIAESSVKSVDDVKKIKNAGFDAVLIGEALVKSKKPSDLISQMVAI